MMRAISRADLVSKPCEASFALSVVRLCNSTLGPGVAVLLAGWCVSAVVVIVAIGFYSVPESYCLFYRQLPVRAANCSCGPITIRPKHIMQRNCANSEQPH